MAIEAHKVAGILLRELPEFTEAVEEHRQDWGDDPMLYLLIGPLFTYVAKNRFASERERLMFATRAYAVTDKMLTDGTPSVRDCFSIQMIEPLSGDPKVGPDYTWLEGTLGPAARRDLAAKREWSRRYGVMDLEIKRLNVRLGSQVFRGVGIGENNARVIVEPAEWNRLTESNKDEAYHYLRDQWEETTGHVIGLTITGPRETGFEILRGRERFGTELFHYLASILPYWRVSDDAWRLTDDNYLAGIGVLRNKGGDALVIPWDANDERRLRDLLEHLQNAQSDRVIVVVDDRQIEDWVTVKNELAPVKVTPWSSRSDLAALLGA